MKLKKMLALSMAAVMMAAAFSGCSGASQSSSGTAATPSTAGAASAAPADNGKKKTIALFMTHMSNAFTMELSGAVKAQAEKLGYTVVVNDASQDAGKQTNQIETTVTQGVDGIIIEPVSVDGVVPAVKEARAAKIPVVIINQQISDPTAASCYVGASNVQCSEVEMTQAMKDISGQGNVALLLGPMGSDAQIGRSQGYKNVLAKNTGSKVVFESTAEWDTDKAMKLAENWLQSGKDIKAIVSHNDNMALGAVKAIEDAKMQDKIKVYGIDATPEGLQAVKDGRLAATVSQGTTQQGVEGVNAVDKLIKGETVKAETIVPSELITKANVDKYLTK
jgi:ribose transport system substrate-binding protein/inositol transport system substrate-binding protein